jgi:Trk-type K+ transport system membrane component
VQISRRLRERMDWILGKYASRVKSRADVFHRWVGAFNCVSAFNNSGMSLLDQNMIPFGRSPFILMSMGLFILAGNTCYPIFLRLFIWTLRRCLPSSERWAELRHTLQFLLDHPRRCYTNLFPGPHTWWLLGAVVVLNGIDCIMYVVLNVSIFLWALVGSDVYRLATRSLRVILLALNSLMVYSKRLPYAVVASMLSQ